MPPYGAFEIKFDMGHPVAGFDERKTLPHLGIGQLHPILGLTEMNFLLIGISRSPGVFSRCRSGRFRKRFDVHCRKSEHPYSTRDVLHGLLAEIGESYRKLAPDLFVCRP